MVDMAAIGGAIASLQTAGQIAKSFVGIRDAAVIQSKVIELQTEILAAQHAALAAQSDQFTLLQRIRELEEQTAKLEAWEAEKQRYELKDYGGGTFAYELKPEEARGEPSHRVCAACYQKGQKSILQFDYETSAGQFKFNCPACKTVFEFGHRSSNSSRVLRSRPRNEGW